MPKSRPETAFILQEVIRSIVLNKKYALSFFVFLSLNYLLLILVFTAAININYLIESYYSGLLPFALETLLIFLVNRIVFLKFLFFISFLISTLILVYLNKKYIDTFIILYQHEIKLVNKLSCNNKMVRLPLLLTAFIINVVSLGIVFLLSGFIYRYSCVMIGQYLTGFNFIKYQNFNISLLFFLSLITAGGIFSSSRFLFWKHKLG